MSDYYIHAVLLHGCSYSNKAYELLKNNNIKNIVEIVPRENKEKFKMDGYDTYPQLFLKREHSKESLFLGGYDDLKNFMDKIKNHPNDLKNNINYFQSKHREWSDKAVLRLIQLMIST